MRKPLFRAFALVAALVSSSSLSLAQIPVWVTDHELVPFPPGYALPVDAGRLEVGYFAGDGTLGALKVNGGNVLVSPWIDVHSAFQKLPDISLGSGDLVANDIAIVRDGAAAGDAIAAVGPNGLEIFRMGPEGFVIEEIASGGWVGALAVRCVDFNGDGILDVIGLVAGGDGLEVHLGQPGGGWLAGLAISWGFAVNQIVPVQWNDPASSPELEIGYTTLDSMGVLGQDGEKDYERFSSLAAGSHLERIRNGSGVLDSLGWLISNGTMSFLSVVSASDLHVIPFPGLLPQAFATHDVNGDGFTDAVITWANSWFVLVLFHVGSSTAYDPVNDGWQIDTTPEPVPTEPGGNYRPAVGDVDGDGVMDIVLPSFHAAAYMILNGPVSPDLPESPYLREFDEGTSELCENDAENGYLSFDMTYQGLTSDTDGFDCIIWVRDDYGSNVNTTAISNCWLAKSGESYLVDFNIPKPTNQSGQWEDDPKIYYVLVRPWDVGTQLQTGPALVGVYSMDTDALIEADAIWSNWDLLAPVPECGETLDPGLGAGGFLHSKRITPFGPNTQVDISAGCTEPVNS